MTTKFSNISDSTRTLHVQVAREIGRGILSGSLPEGALLTGEVYLCGQFGVSRTALREAVKLLTSKGLLESRPKVGTRVMARANWNFLDPQLIGWMDGLIDNDEFCLQFLGLRKVIEPEACALAAKYATVSQRVALSEVFQKMCVIDGSNPFKHHEWIDIDIQFHKIIFESTGNNFFLPFANILTTMFTHFIAHSSQDGGTCIEEHCQIYEAIMAGNSDKAKEASLNHLQESKHRL